MNIETGNAFVDWLLTFMQLWLCVCVAISLIGGWFQLGLAYRAQDPLTGTKLKRTGLGLRLGVGYINCVTFHVCQEGLGITVSLPFRILHPPLFVPWSELHVFVSRLFGFKTVSLGFRKVRSVRMSIPPSFATRLAAAAGPCWPDPGT